MLAAEGALQFGEKFVHADGGEKAQAAEIDGEQRNLAAADGARGGEQRAIAAQHDDQIAAFGHVLARECRFEAACIGRGLFVGAHGDAARAQPLDKLRAPARAACAEFGLEQIPTVLMAGMEQKLLVPFRARIGLSMMRSESEFLHRALHAFAGSLVQRRIANDAALTHLALAHFELRFDQYNHLPAGL